MEERRRRLETKEMKVRDSYEGEGERPANRKAVTSSDHLAYPSARVECRWQQKHQGRVPKRW